MAPADAVWWRGDTTANRVVISAVLWFDGPLDVPRLRTLVEERLLTRHPVFGERVVVPRLATRMPRREPDPDLDLRRHIREEHLTAPGSHAELERRCSDERSTPLDPDRPPWAATVYQGYRGTGSAMHVRLHHSLGDGLALMQLLLTLADEFDPDLVPLAEEPARADRAGTLAGRLAGTATDLTLRPWRIPGVARHGLRTAGLAAHLLWPAEAPPSRLRGRPTGRKRMAWSPEGLEVADLLAASHARGVTVNDLMLAVTAGGIHRYLAEFGALVDRVLVLVPVSTRELGAPLPRSVGNHIGLLPVHLPVGTSDHEERVARIHAATSAVKEPPAPAVSHALTVATTLFTPGIERAIHRTNQRDGTGVVTNVIGPALELHVAGARLLGVIGWGGVTGQLNLSAGFISLGNRVFSGLVTDEAITPDPRRLLEHIEDEWREVLPTDPSAHRTSASNSAIPRTTPSVSTSTSGTSPRSAVTPKVS
jgi:diacylglycerol O-acyltransferase / wax synthase